MILASTLAYAVQQRLLQGAGLAVPHLRLSTHPKEHHGRL
jgi:hypothetical protein